MSTSSEWKPANRECPNCHKKEVIYRVVESSDGAFEDENYKCTNCGKTWWVDGIDS